MILRIVRLSIIQEKCPEFLQLVGDMKHVVRRYTGCKSLEIVQSVENENVYYTMSTWINEECLEAYRLSEDFINFWAGIKILFAERAKATSLPFEENDFFAHSPN